jgi:hypothetical protein
MDSGEESENTEQEFYFITKFAAFTGSDPLLFEEEFQIGLVVQKNLFSSRPCFDIYLLQVWIISIIEEWFYLVK